MDSDGSDIYQVTHDSTTSHKFFNPQWISNQEISVYDSNNRHPKIIKINIKTGVKEIILKLTNDSGALYSWSPDFSKILYSKWVIGTNHKEWANEVFIYSLDKGTHTRITKSVGQDIALDWK